MLGKSRTYLSINIVDNYAADSDAAPLEFLLDYLISLDFASIPLAVLELKVRSPIIVLRNIDYTHSLCNRT